MRQRAVLPAVFSLVLAGCQPVATTTTDLEAWALEQLDALPAETALYAKHLPSGREIAIRADESVNTLSIIKIPVMILAFRDSEAGLLDLDERHTVQPENMRGGSGVLRAFAPGLAPTYRDILTQMIVTSDNTATDIMISMVGLARVNELLAELGYVETRLQANTGHVFRRLWEHVDPANAELTDREIFDGHTTVPAGTDIGAVSFRFEGTPDEWLGRTSAREMSQLLEQIHDGEIASRQSSDEMLEILARQLYESRIPRHIRFRTRVAHKTGDWPPTAGNDAGIIPTPNGPIVMSVFATQNTGDFDTLEDTEGRIAERLFEEWGSPD